jgi:hypothetical protein
MVRYRCRSCGLEGELEFGRPADDFWCSDECHSEFVRVVKHLAKGGEPAEIGVHQDSRVLGEALKEISRLRRAAITSRREDLEREWSRTRPRLFRPLYPC